MNAQFSVVLLAAATSGSSPSGFDWVMLFVTVLTMIGEFGIVWAILWEVKGTRETNFLQTAFDKSFYDERSALYGEFLSHRPTLGASPNRQELWIKSREFAELLFTDNKIRKVCDSQITHLNQIALLYGKRRWYQRKDELLEWFPHAIVLCWIMLGPYIFERKKLIGHFWAKALVKYALDSVDFIIEDPEAELALFRQTPNEGRVTITRQVLLDVREELLVLGAADSRDQVRRVLEKLEAKYR